jgi:meso-butanediol dehydrogenase/(S,S)-butanediol dehydrogenase/diacetyl reductase
MNLEGRSIIVTGAGRGIGLVAARSLLERGARVTICATTDTSVARAVEVLSAGDRLAAVTADVSTPAGALAVAEEAKASFGSIDGLFANAGLYAEDAVETLAADAWDAVFAANARSCFLSIQAALPALRQAGGAIVTMSSVNGVIGIPGASAYGAAKAAIVNLTRTLALELAPEVRVNCIAPGFVETEALLALPDAAQVRQALAERTPLGRICRPEEIAHALVFALENDFLTGATINLDGGVSAGAPS